MKRPSSPRAERSFPGFEIATVRRDPGVPERMPFFSICLPEKINEIRLSDSRAFWDQDYPELLLTDTSFLRNPQPATRNPQPATRNPHHHQATDTPDTLSDPPP